MRRSTHQLLLSLSQLQGVVDDKDHRDAEIEQGEQCVYPQHTSTNGRGGGREKTTNVPTAQHSVGSREEH